MRQKVITVAQQKGGAGKTTLVAHLSVALVQRGYKVAMLDIDPQASLTAWYRLREQRMGEGYTGMNFAALSGWRVGSEVSRLRRLYDVILIDSPPHVETDARAAIRSADLIVVPVQPSPTDLWATKATLEFAGTEKVPARTLLNRVNLKSKLVETIRPQVPALLDSFMGNRVVYASTLLEGKGVTEADPKSRASQEVKTLVEELILLFPEDLDADRRRDEPADTEQAAARPLASAARAM